MKVRQFFPRHTLEVEKHPQGIPYKGHRTVDAFRWDCNGLLFVTPLEGENQRSDGVAFEMFPKKWKY